MNEREIQYRIAEIERAIDELRGAVAKPVLRGDMNANGFRIQNLGNPIAGADAATKREGFTGPGSSTDNAVARWNGTDGQTLQNSAVTIDDSSNVAGVGNITLSGTVDGRDIAADGSKLDGIESGADVTDSTNVEAAGAVMESDTSTASMSFVIDEDNMASDSATKVPTQQSVKAYADAIAAGVPTAHAASHTDGTDDLQRRRGWRPPRRSPSWTVSRAGLPPTRTRATSVGWGSSTRATMVRVPGLTRTCLTVNTRRPEPSSAQLIPRRSRTRR